MASRTWSLQHCAPSVGVLIAQCPGDQRALEVGKHTAVARLGLGGTHPCIHASIHPCIHASMDAWMHAWMHAWKQDGWMHPCMHGSMHALMHCSGMIVRSLAAALPRTILAAALPRRSLCARVCVCVCLLYPVFHLPVRTRALLRSHAPRPAPPAAMGLTLLQRVACPHMQCEDQVLQADTPIFYLPSLLPWQA